MIVLAAYCLCVLVALVYVGDLQLRYAWLMSRCGARPDPGLMLGFREHVGIGLSWPVSLPFVVTLWAREMDRQLAFYEGNRR